MDYQSYVDCAALPCAVLSVERGEDGACRAVRILNGNQRYRELMGPGFVPGMRYEELVPKDLKFEEYCLRCAFELRRMHTYVEAKALGCWVDEVLVPLEPLGEKLGLCQFTIEFTEQGEAERMAAVSGGAAREVIKACVTLAGSRDFRESVRDVLGDILRASGAEQGRVVLVNHRAETSYSFCELNPGEYPRKDSAFSYAEVQCWERALDQSNVLIVKDAGDRAMLRENAPSFSAQLPRLCRQNLVLIPLYGAQKHIGYLYIADFDLQRLAVVKELVELVAYILGAELSNHLLMNRLEEMSNTDELTGLLNRRAMIRRMGQLGGAPYGVVNLDLNGLKPVNDELGHEAGDRLLVRTAEMLRKVFYAGDIFRTGGDEFIVFTADISQETFTRKVEKLKESAEKYRDISFALGAFWSDGTTDVAVAFRCADERMYADKQAYYAQHPAPRRH